MDNNLWGSHGDLWTGAIAGVICGVIKFLDIYLLADPYSMVLLKVFLTGIIGGFGGVLGKHLFSWVKAKYFTKKNKQP